MKIELFLDEDVHSGSLGDHCFKTTPIQRNDVKTVAPAPTYCERINEKSFGVLVDRFMGSVENKLTSNQRPPRVPQDILGSK
jgi:hypothetical protein